MMVNEISDVVAGSLRVEGLLMGSRVGGRARFDPDKKRELVELFHQSGASLADVASANSLKVDLLRQWVNQARLLSAAERKPRKTKKTAIEGALLPVVIKPCAANRALKAGSLRTLKTAACTRRSTAGSAPLGMIKPNHDESLFENRFDSP